MALAGSLYQQINDKFADPHYFENTRREVGRPDCLETPMYVVGEGSKIPPILRKVGSVALTIFGIITVVPAIYWSVKAFGEWTCLPVSSRILRSIFRSARDLAVSPKRTLPTVNEAIKTIVKMALIGAAVAALGTVSLELGLSVLAGIVIYYIAKHLITRYVARTIKKEYADHIETGPKHLRMSVMVDGERIDTYVIMSHDKIEPGQRWILATNGNGVPAETIVSDCIGKKSSMLSSLKTKLQANVVTYNYGGCLGSEGAVSADKAAKVFQAMKAMLEDPEGLAAKEIVFYGHSIGGAMQANGLRGYGFEKKIRYVCVKDRTFSNTDDQLRGMFPNCVGKVLRSLIRYIGWSIDVKGQCEELYEKKIPQVIINNRYDNVINRDSLSKCWNLGTKESLVGAVLTRYQPTDPDKESAHMDGPTDTEKDEINGYVEKFLTPRQKKDKAKKIPRTQKSDKTHRRKKGTEAVA